MGALTDKVAVITGGISGLGRASALRYAAEGAQVVVADINAERGANAAAEMSASGASIEFVQVDVTSQASQEALFADVVERYGRVDTVLAAAGVSSSGYISGEVSEVEADPEERLFHNRELADWEKVMAVNVTGVMLTNKVAIGHMLAKETHGTIVNIASIAGRRPLPGASDYCVSKACGHHVDSDRCNRVQHRQYPRERHRPGFYRNTDDSQYPSVTGMDGNGYVYDAHAADGAGQRDS
jgi:NAD(P)-dependent dehydrogenase (short-subunit alcohol dehydrogenase family)